MKDKKRVWIHARVSNAKYLDLLSYQEKILTELAKQLDMDIVGRTRDIGDGKNIYQSKVRNIVFDIRNNSIDYIFTFNEDRICTNQEQLSEFKILCAMHDARIVCYDEILSMMNP